MLAKLSTILFASLTLFSATAVHATDLSLSKTALSEEAEIFDLAPLSELTYQIFVRDSTEGVAGLGITMTDNVPSVINITSVETDFGTCDRSGQLVTCDLNGLQDGALATISINGTLAGVVAIGEEISNTAQVQASNEIDPSDNSDTAVFTVANETVVDPEDVDTGGCSLQARASRTLAWRSLRDHLRGF